MGILNSLKRRLNYVVVKPLLYNQELADAYSGTSVVDGELKGKTVVVRSNRGDWTCNCKALFVGRM